MNRKIMVAMAAFVLAGSAIAACKAETKSHLPVQGNRVLSLSQEDLAKDQDKMVDEAVKYSDDLHCAGVYTVIFSNTDKSDGKEYGAALANQWFFIGRASADGLKPSEAQETLSVAAEIAQNMTDDELAAAKAKCDSVDYLGLHQ